MKKIITLFLAAITISFLACNPPKAKQVLENSNDLAVVVLEDRSYSFKKYGELKEEYLNSDFSELYEYVKENGGAFHYAEINTHSDDPFVSYTARVPSKKPVFDPSKINPLKIARAKETFKDDSLKYVNEKAAHAGRDYSNFTTFLAKFRKRLLNRTYSNYTNIYKALKRAEYTLNGCRTSLLKRDKKVICVNFVQK